MLKNKRVAVYLIPVVVIGLLVVGAQSFRTPVPAEEYQECLYNNQADRSKQTECKTDETIWERTKSDPIAYYTLWLTIFTGALAGIGIIQGYLTNQQIRLARDEFNATHRPQLMIHGMEYRATEPADGGVKMLYAHVTGFNIGTSDARNITVSAQILETRERPTHGITFPDILVIEELAPGTPLEFAIDSNISDLAHKTTLYLEDKEGERFGPAVYCMGTIKYLDKSGLRRITGFCWLLEGQRWVRQSKSAYEYAY
jgi:hypothetical protein